MLDPDNPMSGRPLIAFRRELDPDCGLHENEKRFAASPDRLDAALIKAWASYKTWRDGSQPDQPVSCKIVPATNGTILAGSQLHEMPSPIKLLNVIPNIICQIAATVPPRLTSPCPVGPCLTHFRGPRRITRALMNPGFIDPATDDLIRNDGLQTGLNRLLELKHKSRRNRMAVALVDLTGAKLRAPEYAGWREAVQIFGASLPKIAPLYAVFQLQHDLTVIARLSSSRRGRDLIDAATKRWEQEGLPRDQQPKVTELFTLTESPGSPVSVELSPELSNLLCCTIHHSCNRSASILIDKVGFPFMSSALWQMGLFHRTRGGLWLQGNYGERKSCFKEECSQQECNDVFGRATLTSRPVFMRQDIVSGFTPPGLNSQNVTALAAATYFTLMAQGRLPTPAASIGIRSELMTACSFFRAEQSHTPDQRCADLGLRPSFELFSFAAKCGSNSKPLVKHDCILVQRSVGPTVLRYVAVLLTENVQLRNAVCFFRNDFLLDLDNLIQDNNLVKGSQTI